MAAGLAAAEAVTQTCSAAVQDSHLADSPFGTVVVAAQALEASCLAEAAACLAAPADRDQEAFLDIREVDTLVAIVASALQKDQLGSVEGTVGETELPRTDPYSSEGLVLQWAVAGVAQTDPWTAAMTVEDTVAEEGQTDPWAAAMRTEDTVSEEGPEQTDPLAVDVMEEDVVVVVAAEEGQGQTDSCAAEATTEASVAAAAGVAAVAVEEPMVHQMDRIRGLVDSVDGPEHLFADMAPLQVL